jgi:hypothetical protein
MPSTHTVTRHACTNPKRQDAPLQLPKARRASLKLAWAALAASALLNACGGGGDAGSPAPAPPASVVLNAYEEVAWKSYVLRTVGTPNVTDLDENLSNQRFFDVSRRNFAGMYPADTAATAVPGQSNIPKTSPVLGSCKDGGSFTQSINDINKNGIAEAGDSFTNTALNCKDASYSLSQTLRFDHQATTLFYPKPNDNALRSIKGLTSVEGTFTQAAPNYTLRSSFKGQTDIDINETSRVYRDKNNTSVIEGFTIVSNLIITVNRSTSLGSDKPFSLASMTGSLSIDGVTYQVSSTPNIEWKKDADYLPTLGVITMTGPDGERLITQFTPNGVACGIIPANATTPSIVVRNCSRI